jgi:hypothetical protein
LADIVNTRHENTKYLPGIKLPTNVIAVPDLLATVKDAHLLVFVIPHQVTLPHCPPAGDFFPLGVFNSVVHARYSTWKRRAGSSGATSDPTPRLYRSSKACPWRTANRNSSPSSSMASYLPSPQKPNPRQGEVSSCSSSAPHNPGLLDIDVSVLCGANIASEVAKGGFSEATIGTSHYF